MKIWYLITTKTKKAFITYCPGLGNMPWSFRDLTVIKIQDLISQDYVPQGNRERANGSRKNETRRLRTLGRILIWVMTVVADFWQHLLLPNWTHTQIQIYTLTLSVCVCVCVCSILSASSFKFVVGHRNSRDKSNNNKRHITIKITKDT